MDSWPRRFANISAFVPRACLPRYAQAGAFRLCGLDRAAAKVPHAHFATLLFRSMSQRRACLRQGFLNGSGSCCVRAVRCSSNSVLTCAACRCYWTLKRYCAQNSSLRTSLASPSLLSRAAKLCTHFRFAQLLTEADLQTTNGNCSAVPTNAAI